MSKFYNDLKVGQNGEQFVATALTKLGHNVEDVSGKREYQLKDIDFIISKDGASTTLEVKNDVRSCDTGNFFIETYNSNNTSRNNLGWYYYCESDYLAFVQEKFGRALVINRNEIIQLVESGKYRTFRSFDSAGVCVPVYEVEKRAAKVLKKEN